MRLRDSIALTLPSFLLRLVLGITFLWAGTGNLVGTMQVSGDDAARLANLGIDLDPISETPASAAIEEPEADPEPVSPLPNTADEATTPAVPETDAESASNEDLQQQADEIIDQIEKSTPRTDPPTDPPTEPTTSTGVERLGLHAQPAYTLRRVQNSSAGRTGSDFPEPLECQRVYSIALMLSKAADPGLTPDSQPITPIMPAMFANGPWPKLLAWCAAITELVAGAFLILGLLTRISALGTFCVMLVAMWMTQFGPAAMHDTNAILGFIPRADDLFSPAAYGQLLWQLALAAMSLAVIFLGSGAIGLDRLFFSPHPRDPYLHGDPKTAKAGRKQPMNPATAQRTEFDRSPPPAGS